MIKRKPGPKPTDPSGLSEGEQAAQEGVHRHTIRRRKELERLAGPELVQERLRAQTLGDQARADREIRLLAILDAQYLARDVVDEQGRILASVQNAYSAAIRSELPPLLAGLSEAEVERELVRFTDAWDLRLSDERDAIWARAREAVAREARGDLKKVARAKQNGNGGEE